MSGITNSVTGFKYLTILRSQRIRRSAPIGLADVDS